VQLLLGGAAGETLFADVEKLGTIGSAFGVGPTQLDELMKKVVEKMLQEN
jgi:hypothetical protein